ncbi:hypothetical protein BV898_06125 [Hypsibius exemplaris]|uniref:Receptor ligand binding region domain-containing protein n=1 Tax=Hypsibius exemplaris TaxID=2072580 RepID=A0A1W0WXD1_HYPEX|nr:hypothetical protein BV898_06125 [Hypsibius exemplaris]
MGSAYDVAFLDARRLYPEVFRSFSITRHFVPGTFTCADATGETTVALSELFSSRNAGLQRNSSGFDVDEEFRIVLSPGCSFEAVTLGDFGREEDLTVLASVASFGLLNDKQRFPTVLPFASTSYNNLAVAIIGIIHRHGWTSFNLACEKSGLAVEVACGILRQALTTVQGINAISYVLDTFSSETIENFLITSLAHSTVTVLASVNPQSYIPVLEAVFRTGMANGDNVFYLFPLGLNGQFEDIILNSVSANEISESLLHSLPFVFSLAFEPINWTAISVEVDQMTEQSRSVYNMTVPTASHVLEVACGILRQALTTVQGINAISYVLDTFSSETIENFLITSLAHSTVTVLASVKPQSYIPVLEAVFRTGMANGDNVSPFKFVNLDCQFNEEHFS